VARGGNQRGIVGTAPAAGLASWKIFNGDTLPLSDDQLATMFRYRTESVSVQNHSWGNSSYEPLGPSLPEQLAISNAVVQGRGGRGVVMVRSGGNGRGDLINVNEDGYANDPRVMAVASIGIDGRASSFSSPGACLWVAAPGGGSPAVVTTDRLGTAGFNSLVTGGDDADYVVSTSLQGTSFSAPQVSGLAALLLAVNPGLGWRDVREIVALSARQFDLADPGLATNAAGLAHSHNTGFGVPDAGKAVELARRWVNRPTPVEVRFPVAVVQAIPDDGLRVMVTGSGVPPALASIPATPGLGPHADDPTPSLPLVDVDVATNDLTVDLTGKAALIQRGPPGDFSDKRNTFRRKVERAAAAGATFAILWNHTNGTERIIPGDLDFTPIPAVFIDENTGRALRSQLSLDPNLQARLQLTSTELQFTVAQSLRVESVQVRIQSNHSRRGDVRVTLRSPSGTRSVLQQVNFDDLPGPGAAGWTYTSARHLGEPGAGAWSLTVSDEQAGNAGALTGAELILSGQGIVDHDRDGLDDGWETSFFGGLAAGPLEDPDGDGRVTGREQLEGTHPGVSDLRHEVWFSVWNHELGRLSWPGGDGRAYDVLSATNAGGPLEFQAVVPGRFPETEWFVPLEAVPGRFFRVRF
jgi:subtilisin-like proprotein convertase family protein